MESLKKQIREQGNQGSALTLKLAEAIDTNSDILKAFMPSDNLVLVSGIECNEGDTIQYKVGSLDDKSDYIVANGVISNDIFSENVWCYHRVHRTGTYNILVSTKDDINIKTSSKDVKTGFGYGHLKTLAPCTFPYVDYTNFGTLELGYVSSAVISHDIETYMFNLCPRDVLIIKDCKITTHSGLYMFPLNHIKAFVVKNSQLCLHPRDGFKGHSIFATPGSQPSRLEYVVVDFDSDLSTYCDDGLKVTEIVKRKEGKVSYPPKGKFYYNPKYDWSECIKNLPEGWEVYDYIPSDEEIEEAIAPLLKAPHE